MYLEQNLSLSANVLQTNIVYLKPIVLPTPNSFPTLRTSWPNANFRSIRAIIFCTDKCSSIICISMLYIRFQNITQFFICPICHAKISIPLIVSKFDILPIHSLIHHIPLTNRPRKQPSPSIGQPIPP